MLANRMSIKVEQLEGRQLLCGVHLHEEGAPPASPVLATVSTAPLSVSTTVASPKYALNAVPILNSRPGATAQLVLDFNGDAASNWNFGGGTYEVPKTNAYSVDS